MTFWNAISDWFGRTFGTSAGVLGSTTSVIGFFLLFMFGVFGGLLLTMGIIAYRGKMTDKWLATFALGVASLNLLMWALIPGFPLAGLLGVILGLAMAALTVIVYRMDLVGVKNNYILLATGIAMSVISIIALYIEIYQGGGFLV